MNASEMFRWIIMALGVSMVILVLTFFSALSTYTGGGSGNSTHPAPYYIRGDVVGSKSGPHEVQAVVIEYSGRTDSYTYYYVYKNPYTGKMTYGGNLHTSSRDTFEMVYIYKIRHVTI